MEAENICATAQSPLRGITELEQKKSEMTIKWQIATRFASFISLEPATVRAKTYRVKLYFFQLNANFST